VVYVTVKFRPQIQGKGDGFAQQTLRQYLGQCGPSPF
jgi:hypothetical protein